MGLQPWASVASAVRQLVGPPTIGALVVTGVPTGFTGMITERDVVRAINTVRHRLEEIQLETNVLRDLYHTRH